MNKTYLYKSESESVEPNQQLLGEMTNLNRYFLTCCVISQIVQQCFAPKALWQLLGIVQCISILSSAVFHLLVIQMLKCLYLKCDLQILLNY